MFQLQGGLEGCPEVGPGAQATSWVHAEGTHSRHYNEKSAEISGFFFLEQSSQTFLTTTNFSLTSQQADEQTDCRQQRNNTSQKPLDFLWHISGPI